MEYHYIAHVHAVDTRKEDFQGVIVASDYLEAIKRIVYF